MKLLRAVRLALGLAWLGWLLVYPTLAAEPASAPSPSPEMTREEKEDAETGKKASAEIEKEFKVVENPPDLPRLEGIVAQLRPATEKPNLQYTLKVLDSNAINAFSLPGGYIYFTKGLIGAVESDDELAAVTAHEMAHVCLRHARQLMERDESYNRVLGSVVLAALLAQKQGLDPGRIAVMGNLVKLNAVNHYGREAELEADRGAVRYLSNSGKYNPVGVLTVVEGLARMDLAQPRPDQGALQTHPLAQERVTQVMGLLGEMKVPLERGRVTRGLTAMAAVVVKEEREIAELRLSDRVVFQPAVEMNGLSPLARAQQSAGILNPMLLENLELVEITRLDREGAALVRAKGETVLTITPADATFHGSTVEALAKQAMQAIQVAFQAEKLKRAY